VSKLAWEYGITTVPSRRGKELPATLNSLCDAGFGNPRIFVDGCDDPSPYAVFERPVTCRPPPPLKIVGNWMLSLWELYVRNADAHRYAIFQDDILAIGNLRKYLDSCPYPPKGYWNLYTHKENVQHTKTARHPTGVPGWCLSNLRGLGALGLVFDRAAAQTMLASRHMVDKPASAQQDRRSRKVDGGILEGMKKAGYKEWIHNPSLLQHTGIVSTIGNKYPPIPSFPGTEFDAMSLIDSEETT